MQHKGLEVLQGVQGALEPCHRRRPELDGALDVPTMYGGRRAHDRGVLQALHDLLPNLSLDLHDRNMALHHTARCTVPAHHRRLRQNRACTLWHDVVMQTAGHRALPLHRS